MDKKIKTIHIIVAIVIVAVVGGAFYGGMLYGKSKTARPNFQAGNFPGTKNKTGSANGGSFLSGDILSKDNGSITLQISNNGGSKIIFFSDKTQINKSAAGTADDLAKGTSVSVTGTTNSDGSITAQSIQIRTANANPGEPNQPSQGK